MESSVKAQSSAMARSSSVRSASLSATTASAMLSSVLKCRSYQGKSAPLNTVAFGDNWFYSGTNGYNLGSGLGTLDVFNFAQYLRGQF
jgi:hypothetical protein